MRYYIASFFLLFLACTPSVQNNSRPDTARLQPDTPAGVITDTTVLIHENPLDKELFEYESLIAHYSKATEKALAGDVKALTECTFVSVKLKSAEKELMDAAVNMTAGQQKKLKELYNRYEAVSAKAETVKKK